ncbi:IS66 family insertion sequence element accessory protein TnpA [Solidesulfovibrio aerotolerans]|uniref:IS66 family insertion sequence element accessory protein TnpA n=1 Tax=Solidesulfovibrio aerotolerans TaxID=295255 RepID=UPI003F6E0D0F
MVASAPEHRSEKAAYWAGHIETWRGSGLSQGAYCRRQGLSQSSWGYWRKRLARLANEEAAPCFAIVPVPLSASPQGDMATTPEPMLVHVGNAFRIEIRGDFAAPVLEKLVRTLTRL